VKRQWRWLIACASGVAALAFTWWLTQRQLGLDPGAAQALGGAALALVTLPMAWWATLGPADEHIGRRKSGPIRVGVPLRNPYFVGRATLLKKLHDSLADDGTVVVKALQGMGGVGKTQLAVEYTHRYGSEYAVICWLDAEQPEFLADQLAEVATSLDVPGSAATVRAVLDEMARRGRWLVVFDNARRPADLADFIPGAGGGHVIVTSRQINWSPFAVAVDVDVMTRHEATTLLARRLPGIAAATADDIAERLGDLPLAIEQAAAFLEQTATDPVDYLTLLATRSEELLSKGFVFGHDRTVLTLWDLSREQLADTDPAAVQLLTVCAFLGPEPIPLRLLADHPAMLPEPLSAAMADPIRFTDVVGALVRYSLARRTSDGLIVHRLLAEAVRISASPEVGSMTLSVVRSLLLQSLPESEAAGGAGWWRRRRSRQRLRRDSLRLLPHVATVTVPEKRETGDDDPVAAAARQTTTLLNAHQRLIAAQAADRSRLERDLHDGVQPQLLAVLFRLHEATRRAESDEQRAELRACADLIQEANRDLRTLMRQGPNMLDDYGLRFALRHAFGAAAIPVLVDVPDERYERITELVLYFAISEAVTNSLRHADATSVRVDLRPVPDGLRLRVSDDGRGGVHERPGGGLAGIRDRLLSVGGRMTVDSSPAAGTVVTVEIPEVRNGTDGGLQGHRAGWGA
jgi:signal transduction histidine kinase